MEFISIKHPTHTCECVYVMYKSHSPSSLPRPPPALSPLNNTHYYPQASDTKVLIYKISIWQDPFVWSSDNPAKKLTMTCENWVLKWWLPAFNH